MPSVSTVQARSVLKIAAAAREGGADVSELYRAAGFDASALADPDARIPFAQLVALYEQAARLTGDDAFGLHVGESVTPTMFDVVGYLTVNSATLGEAYRRLARFHSIWTDGASFSIKENAGEARLSYDYAEDITGGRRHDCEMTLATVVVFMRRVTEIDWLPREVSFQHARPADTSAHGRIFRAPLRFSAPRNELAFDSALLRLPLARADANLVAVLDRHAEELLARLPPRGGACARVRKLVAESFGAGEPGLAFVSRRLGLSARTLQRKLKEEGSSFQDVLDEVRRDAAERYLRGRDLAICEVAYLLGFSEPSAFHRAFRRWTGVTPAEFRRRAKVGSTNDEVGRC